MSDLGEFVSLNVLEPGEYIFEMRLSIHLNPESFLIFHMIFQR